MERPSLFLFMKKIYLLLFVFFFCFSLTSYSANHNQLDVEIERLKKDITDLQKFVYQTEPTNSSSNEPIDLSEINKSLEAISSRLSSLELQIKDMKEDISNLYSLYTSPKVNSNQKITNSDELNIEESASQLVTEKSQNNNTIGQMSLSSLEKQALSSNQEEDKAAQELNVTNQSNEFVEEVATNKEVVNEELLGEIDESLSKPKIDIEAQYQIAKSSIASLDNQSAIDALLTIINSDSNNSEMLAESYYLLGRTYFLENNMIEAVKYFGIRHRDFSNIDTFRSENYFWLGKSLFNIGDQENGCLIMEDIIFSNQFTNKLEIIDSAKILQGDKDCGLIID
jgi:TolA-binding protein